MFTIERNENGTAVMVPGPGPDTHSESSTAPTVPGVKHGQYGPALTIRDSSGFCSSEKTGSWRWCGKCGEWRKAVAIIGCMVCPTCHEGW